MIESPLFFGFSFLHHGPHTAFRGLARALAGEAEVMDVTPPFPDWMPAKFKRRLQAKWFLWSERKVRPCFDGSARCIHYFFPENTLRQAAEWKTRERLVLTLHQPPETMDQMRENPYFEGFFRSLARADHLVVQASSQLAYFTEAYPQIPVSYIPLGVATDHYRRRLPYRGGPGDSVRYLTIGNWMRDYATWAKTVTAMRDRPDSSFRVIANRDVLAEIRSLFPNGLPPSVTLLSGLSDAALQEEYERATVFYLPLDDAMANDALLEALSLGVPTVVTDLPATRDYAGDTVQYIPKGDVDAAVHALLNLTENPAAALALGTQARKRAEEYFDWQPIAKAYLSTYA